MNNEPHYVGYLESGQRVRIQRDEIDDWMYFEDGSLRGGYTIVALVYGTKKQDQYEADMKIDWDQYGFLHK